MIGFFLDPYPDELLYSICARLRSRTRYPNIATITPELFGRNASAIVDLPGRLDILISQLPPGHLYTTDLLIEEHTLFPFYAPFISPTRLQSAKEDLCSANANRVRERLGITAGRIKLPRSLRFCLMCVNEDRKKYGETYWHRIHQVTGVEICPHHIIPLEISNTPWKDRGSPGKLITAESSVHSASIASPKPPKPQYSILHKIALDASWLLCQHNLNIGPEILNRRYYNLLLRHGYAYYNGRIKAGKLLRDFIDFYSLELLDRLLSPAKFTTHSWVLRLALKDKAKVVQHPLRHLLLLTFLGYTAERVLSQFTEYKPFSDGPWPCLNRASDHFKEFRIVDGRIVDSLVKGKSGRPMGIFSCDCGFIYTRMGPDKSEDDISRADSVRAYGHVWEGTLRELWSNPTFTIREMACTLGIYEATVVRRAIQMGLPYPRNSSGPKLSAKVSERYLMRRKGMLDALEDRRRSWLSIIEAHPDTGRKQLMRISNYLYFWLRRNDLEWFEQHLPPTRNTYRRPSLIDWKSVDSSLSTSVRESAIRIKSMVGRPVRISITAIIKEVGRRSWLERSLDKLPLTAKVIKEFVESPEAIEIRRVLWSAECYMREGFCPTRTQFTMRAGVRNKTGRTSAVKNAIDAVMERLSKELR